MQASQDSGGQHQQRRAAAPAGRNPTTGSQPMQRLDDVSELVREVARLLEYRAAGSIAELGINHVRHAVLRAVGDTEPDGCTQVALAKRLRQSESNICTLVERMRSDGLIYRRRSKTDRRKRILGLTDAGRRLLTNAELCCQQQSNQLRHTLTAHQHAALAKLLRLLIDALSQDALSQDAVSQDSPAQDIAAAAASPRQAGPPDPHFVSNCDGMIKSPSTGSTEWQQREAAQ